MLLTRLILPFTCLQTFRWFCGQAKLSGFEVIKAFFLEPTPWDPGGEAFRILNEFTDASQRWGMIFGPFLLKVLTPTFKLQRNKAKDKYQAR